MPIIDLSNPINVLVALILYVLMILVSRKTRRSSFICILLLIFLIVIVGHCIEYITIDKLLTEKIKIITRCIAVDFVFIFLSFISYLWIDDIESKERKIKSIDNSLDWFWKKI